MTITKQRVEEIISRIEMYGHGAGYTAEEVYALAVLSLNLSNIANLKRYELDMSGCDSCGQDCGADMTEDPDGEFVMFDDVVSLVQFDTTTQQFESLSNHKHHFINGTCVECLKSEQLPVHINYQCALCGARFSGDVWMTTRSEYLRDISYKLAEWSSVVNDREALSRKTPMELENLLDEASKVMMEESHLHKRKEISIRQKFALWLLKHS